jgi:hypothetical protein
MTDDLWFAAAIAVFLVAGVWALNRLPRATADESDQDDWDQTAADAARADVDADVAETRRQREIADLEATYKIRSPRRNTIPQQTRRTEEDQ